MKDDRAYLLHIIDSIDQILEYTDQLSILEFKESRMVQDAVIRNFEIIGEATKQVSNEIKKKFNEIRWKSMSGMRDILIHNYMGVDLNVVWKTVGVLPKLRQDLNQILTELKD